MKLLITTALAAAIATTAAAGNSDRYNDQRFDSAVGHISSFDNSPRVATFDRTVRGTTFAQPQRQQRVILSTRNQPKGTQARPYAYANPYGVGPNNDSR
ncbi:MAG: hypothetical protein AAF744_01315 [Pseudomonadota bacterium]